MLYTGHQGSWVCACALPNGEFPLFTPVSPLPFCAPLPFALSVLFIGGPRGLAWFMPAVRLEKCGEIKKLEMRGFKRGMKKKNEMVEDEEKEIKYSYLKLFLNRVSVCRFSRCITHTMTRFLISSATRTSRLFLLPAKSDERMNLLDYVVKYHKEKVFTTHASVESSQIYRRRKKETEIDFIFLFLYYQYYHHQETIINTARKLPSRKGSKLLVL